MKTLKNFSVFLIVALMAGCNGKIADSADDSTPAKSTLTRGDTVAMANDVAYSFGLSLKNVEENKLYVIHSMDELAAVSTIRKDTTALVDFSKSSILIVRGTSARDITRVQGNLIYQAARSYTFVVDIKCSDAKVAAAPAWQLCMEAPVTVKDNVALEIVNPKE